MNALPLAVFVDATTRVWNALFEAGSPLIESMRSPVELELDEEIVHLHHCSGAWARDEVDGHLVKIAAA
jgi:hypothetical protein